LTLSCLKAKTPKCVLCDRKGQKFFAAAERLLGGADRRRVSEGRIGDQEEVFGTAEADSVFWQRIRRSAAR
jgi:hypothetical protein